MILSYEEIINLLDTGVVVGSDPKYVNAASLDIRLGENIKRESKPYDVETNLRDRKPMNMVEETITEYGFVFKPGQFILAHSIELFNLPDDLSAQYHLKSSMGRIGLDHCLAGWCDAGWNGSALTMELKNVSQFHYVRLFTGDLIGQMVFHRHNLVPRHASYATRGRYNGDRSVEGMKK